MRQNARQCQNDNHNQDKHGIAEITSREVPPCHIRVVETEDYQKNKTNNRNAEQQLISEISPSTHWPIFVDWYVIHILGSFSLDFSALIQKNAMLTAQLPA